MARLETLNWILTALVVLFIGGSIFKAPMDEATDDSIVAESINGQLIDWIQSGESGKIQLIDPATGKPIQGGSRKPGGPGEGPASTPGDSGDASGNADSSGRSTSSSYDDPLQRYYESGRERPIPVQLQKRFQSKQDVYDLAMTASSEFVTLQDGTQALMIKEIDEDSLIRKVVGLQDGDLVLSINGMMVQDKSKGWDMYEQLRYDRQFEVKLVRNNRTINLKYRFQ